MSATLYNTTDGPLAIDRAGRMLGARERLEGGDVDSSPIAGHIAAGRIVVLEGAPQPGADEDGFGGDAPQPADPPTKRTRKGSDSTSTQEG